MLINLRGWGPHLTTDWFAKQWQRLTANRWTVIFVVALLVQVRVMALN